MSQNEAAPRLSLSSLVGRPVTASHQHRVGWLRDLVVDLTSRSRLRGGRVRRDAARNRSAHRLGGGRGTGLTPMAGHLAGALFAVGLIGAALLAAAVLPLSSAYSICDLTGSPAALDSTFREADASMSAM